MADFLQGLDPGKLVLAETVLAFISSPFASPPYNFPLFLFGSYIHESSEASQSFRTFTGILGLSIISDIIWMARNDQSGFIRFITILVLLLKLPTTAAFLFALRQRGVQFSSLGNNIGGATVWSMPGGFTSSGRDGYQAVDEEPQPQPQPKTNAPPPTAAPAAAVGQSGAYQSV